MAKQQSGEGSEHRVDAENCPLTEDGNVGVKATGEIKVRVGIVTEPSGGHRCEQELTNRAAESTPRRVGRKR